MSFLIVSSSAPGHRSSSMMESSQVRTSEGPAALAAARSSRICWSFPSLKRPIHTERFKIINIHKSSSFQATSRSKRTQVPLSENVYKIESWWHWIDTQDINKANITLASMRARNMCLCTRTWRQAKLLVKSLKMASNGNWSKPLPYSCEHPTRRTQNLRLVGFMF